MRSTLFVTAAVLLLALPTAAGADDRDRHGSDRYDDRYRDRYEDRYEDRDRGRSRNERVAVIAHEIENTAAAMHREYERNNRRPDHSEARVAATLHELHEQADRFHREVESYRRGSRGSARSYEGLLRAFDEVAESLDHIRPRPYVDRGMDRIWSLVSELDRHYGRSDRHGRGGYDRHGRGHGSRGRYRDRYDHDRR